MRGASTARSSTGSASNRPPSTTATRSRSANTGSPSSPADVDDRSSPRAPAHDRHRVSPAESGVPRHLDLEDPVPRGPGSSDAQADAGRLPALRRGRRRAARDDPASPARRVPAAARDPARTGLAVGSREGAPPPAGGRAGRAGRRAEPLPAVRAGRDHARACARPRGVRAAPSAPRGQREALPGDRRRHRGRLREALSLRDLGAPPAHLPYGRRPRGRPPAPAARAGAALAEPRAARRRHPAARDARGAGAGALTVALLARPAAARLGIGVSETLKAKIRDIPDFPEQGIVFKDIMPLLADPATLRETVDLLAEWIEPRKPDVILGAEARGFILGAALAYKLGCGFVAARRPGKLPWKTVSATYALEYGENALELHADAIAQGQPVLMQDDVLATG